MLFYSKWYKQFIQAEINCKQQNGDLASNLANTFDNNALRDKNYGCTSLRAALVAERRNSARSDSSMLTPSSATCSSVYRNLAFST